MHFYPHNIADFNNATRHLTRVERSVYRDAIEHYYDTESALTKDFKSLSKRLLCFTEEEKEALKTVLSEFFTETDEGFFHERCNAEILKYRANTSAKAKAGIASAAKRKQKSTDVEHVLSECKTDVQLTNNQELITIQTTLAGRVCKKLNEMQFMGINPSNPKFLALINSGGTYEEFIDMANTFSNGQKKFNYLLGAISNARSESANIPAAVEKNAEPEWMKKLGLTKDKK